METITINRGSRAYPIYLERLHKPPAKIYCLGGNLTDLLNRPRVGVVGSRLISPYGRQVTNQLARQLAEQGIVIVSGLALGVDAAAHQAALSAGGLTLAVLPSPVEAVAPATNRRLAHDITASGGVLVSAYPAGSTNQKHNFLERNQLVAALSDVLLITEAAQKSGSLHTAQFAIDQGKEVLAVPGNITSTVSVGTNNLIKGGATPVTSYHDVLRALHIDSSSKIGGIRGDNPQQQLLLDLINTGVNDGDELLATSHLAPEVFNQTITMLEITAKILPLGANHWGLP